jgi:hypothetical protein
LDTGSSVTFVPTLDYYTLKDAITIDKNCEDYFGLLICPCSNANDSSYPVVTLTFGTNKTFKMFPNNYFEFDPDYGCWF